MLEVGLEQTLKEGGAILGFGFSASFFASEYEMFLECLMLLMCFSFSTLEHSGEKARWASEQWGHLGLRAGHLRMVWSLEPHFWH